MKKSAVFLVIVFLAIAIAALCCIGVLVAMPTQTQTQTYNVVYSVHGSRLLSPDKTFIADLTLTVPGGTSQRDVIVPGTKDNWQNMGWSSEEFTVKAGQFLHLSAQSQHESSVISCAIYVNGRLLRHVVSHGDYCICTVSGIAGKD